MIDCLNWIYQFGGLAILLHPGLSGTILAVHRAVNNMFRLIRWVMDKLITMVSADANRAFADNTSFPWITRMEAHWETIRNEFDQVMLDQKYIPNVEDISQDGNLGADRQPMSKGPEWKWFFLYGYGHRIDLNCARCPQTTQLVESIPGMRGAIFAVLAPKKHIPPHQGLYKGLLRCHLGVRIPQPVGLCRIESRTKPGHGKMAEALCSMTPSRTRSGTTPMCVELS